MLLTVNERKMQLERFLADCRKEYNILVDTIIILRKEYYNHTILHQLK
jgi:hypothetical protein